MTAAPEVIAVRNYSGLRAIRCLCPSADGWTCIPGPPATPNPECSRRHAGAATTELRRNDRAVARRAWVERSPTRAGCAPSNVSSSDATAAAGA
jgi:hypothetical protein